ncbi:hypothetical protein [Terriglobus sp.]|uniref:hypothetical protein n=1 Tax=Terriglobus sp. TaxID=1889013 RepID=UPI003B000645
MASAFDVSRKRWRQKGVGIALSVSLLCGVAVGCCGPNDPNCRNTSIGPSGGEVAGVAIGVGAVVGAVIVVGVHHAHHTLSGCTSDGPGGMQIQAKGDAKGYLLSGNTANIPAGERVRLHGKWVKAQKNGTAGQTFVVEGESKDYGPCKQNLSASIRP